MPVSLQRLAQNQVLVREVNERLAEVAPSSDDGAIDFLCECSRPECTETIALTMPEYDGVRSSPNLFVILPGHDLAEVDRVVETNGRFALVEKTFGAALAERTDPRSRKLIDYVAASVTPTIGHAITAKKRRMAIASGIRLSGLTGSPCHPGAVCKPGKARSPN